MLLWHQIAYTCLRLFAKMEAHCKRLPVMITCIISVFFLCPNIKENFTRCRQLYLLFLVECTNRAKL
jgi:hypothetical protein